MNSLLSEVSVLLLRTTTYRKSFVLLIFFQFPRCHFQRRRVACRPPYDQSILIRYDIENAAEDLIKFIIGKCTQKRAERRRDGQKLFFPIRSTNIFPDKSEPLNNLFIMEARGRLHTKSAFWFAKKGKQIAVYEPMQRCRVGKKAKGFIKGVAYQLIGSFLRQKRQTSAQRKSINAFFELSLINLRNEREKKGILVISQLQSR